jgi:uncharacterized protein with ParB-like and HNH nuclease domain
MISQEVQLYTLVDLVRKVQTGEIQIPDFQRPYAWNRQQIMELFESVYRGYPIGTLVLWRSESISIPTVPVPAPSTQLGRSRFYVIDGAQRLITIYRGLDPSTNSSGPDFRIIFDLDEKVFRPLGTRNRPRNYVQLSSILSPRLFDDATISAGVEWDRIISTVTELHRRFIQYSVPVLTLVSDSVDEIISVFEALNTTGVRLSPTDVRRAEATRARFSVDG